MDYIDKLKERLDQVKGLELFQTLGKLIDLHMETAPETSIDYAEKALELAQELQDRKTQADAHIYMASACSESNDHLRAISEYSKALAIAEELHDNDRLAKSLHGLGNSYWYVSDFENSILYNLRLLDVHKRRDDRSGIATTLNNIAVGYRGLGQFHKALESFYEALNIRDELHDEKGMANVLSSIAVVQHNLGQLDKALETQLRVLAIREKLGDKSGIGASLINIGSIYCDLGEYEKALGYQARALVIKREHGDRRGEAGTLNNIGNIYGSQRQYDQALLHYRQAMDIKEELQDQAGLADTSINIAQCYMELNEPEMALPYIQTGLQIAEKMQAKHLLANGNELLSRYYETNGKYQESLNYFKQFAAYRDQILMTETSTHINELQTRYETEKKNREVEYYRAKMHEIQSVLSNIASAVRQSANIDILYDMIKSSLSRLIDTTNFYIGLYDKHTDMVTLPILIDNEDDIRSFPARKTLTSLVIKGRKSLLVDAKAIEQLIMDGEIELIGSPSKIWLGVPLILEDEVIGVIVVQSYDDEDTYKEEDLELLEFVSFQVATSIERKHREQELDFQARLLDNIKDQVIATDLQGHITYVNKAVNGLLEYSQKEMLGKTVHILGDDAEGFSQQTIIEQTLQNGEWSGTVVNITKSGERKFLESRTWLIYDENGQPKGMVGVSSDISERKRTEEERLRLATAIEQAAEAVIITDRDGCIEYVNPAFERTSGYSLVEVIGKKPSLLKSGKQDGAYYRTMWKTILSGKIWHGQLVNKRKDGALYDEESTITPIRNEHGVITNYVAVQRDVTEERRLEAQLMQSQKMEAIGTLAGGIAHDFNNILSLILGYTELAMKHTTQNSKIHASLTEVTKAGNRAKDLVQQILAFSRQSEQQKKPVQVRLIVKEALKMLRSSLPATIQIEQDLQSESVIYADPTQIHQIVMNLCTNAYHAMRDEGGVLRIQLADVTRKHLRSKDNQQQTAKYLKMTVSDTGHGIPAEIIDRIFEPYFTTKGKGEGTGLGLAIIHGIVTSHDGHIELSSKVGQGTTFDIYFPVVEEVEEMLEEEEQAPEDVTSVRVLFVDDEESLAELYTKTLQSFGHNVTAVTSPLEAIRLLKRDPVAFDIVITDLTMPKLTGVKMAIQMQAVSPGIPVILCSGYSENVDRDLFEEAGIRDLIIKPIATMKLVNCIETIMQEKKKKK